MNRSHTRDLRDHRSPPVSRQHHPPCASTPASGSSPRTSTPTARSAAVALNAIILLENPKVGAEHPNAKAVFKCGYVVNTLNTYDTTLQRPYNLGFRVQGTEDLWQHTGWGDLDQGMLYFEKEMDHSHRWANSMALMEQYAPQWKHYATPAAGGGHGGNDLFVDHAFIQCIKRKEPFPLDVYDVATWYAINPLREKSSAGEGQVQDIPDLTEGKCQEREPSFGSDDRY